jgi:hypothetical protein
LRHSKVAGARSIEEECPCCWHTHHNREAEQLHYLAEVVGTGDELKQPPSWPLPPIHERKASSSRFALLSSVVTVKGSAEAASKRGWWDWQEEALGRAANAEMSQWLVKGMAVKGSECVG